jgi:DinB superfamily
MTTVQYAASIADIDRERARLRLLLRSKAPGLLNRRPPNGAWSVVENVRHLLFAEQLHLGGFLPHHVEWSPLGVTGMTAKKYAMVGQRATGDVDEVFAEWDALHRPIRAAVKSATGPEVEKALWRNHMHLRIHIDVIERLLRRP